MMDTKNIYLDKFIDLYGGSSYDVKVFFAPGRVNLIGEHTDYNGGYVFPAALTYGIWLYARKRNDQRVLFHSLNFDKTTDCSLGSLEYKEEHDWANYPKGVIVEFLKVGTELEGLDLLFYGNIPNGAGLSSSASIELVTALALNTMFNQNYETIDLIKMSQQAENQYIGVNCGIMDQFAVGMGKLNNAILLDCQSLEYEHTPMDIDGYKLVITNTNKRRGLADSKYNERRSQCEQGVEQLQTYLPHINSLGDVSLEDWNMYKTKVNDLTIRNRVEHVINENLRVLQANKVLKASKLEEFGQLMLQSHESLRDLYEVTGFELDTLFDIARNVKGCIGTRMTGAGFGGCTISLVEEERVEEFKKIVHEQYVKLIGYAPSFYVCDIGDGATEITQEVEKWPY
jgi:galactokinase